MKNRYAIVIFDKETGQEYAFDNYEMIDVCPDKGVKFDPKTKLLTDNGQSRITIKAWSGCKKYEDFELFSEKEELNA
jgi:hypothetical protein